jgi:hypothetical protein
MSIHREIMAAGSGCAVANGVLNGFKTAKVKLQLQDTAKLVYRCTSMTGGMQTIVK